MKTVAWKARSRGRIHSRIVHGSGRCFWVSRTGWVSAVDAESGRLDWRVHLPEAVARVASLAVSDGLVYVAGARHVMALSQDEGRTLWITDLDTLSSRPESLPPRKKPHEALGAQLTPATSGVVAHHGWHIHFLDRRHGTRLWSQELKSSQGPVAVEGDIGAVSGSEHCWGIDLHNGSVRWTAELHDYFFNHAPAVVRDGAAYSPTGNGGLLAVDLQTGRERWRQHGPAPVPLGGTAAMGHGVYLAPVVGARHVVYGTRLGLLRCLDRATGRILWSDVVRPGAVFDLALLDDYTFVAGDRQVVARRMTDGAEKWRLVPSRRQSSLMTVMPDRLLYPAGRSVIAHTVE
ncbi:PQQ-binding-like beta-propeller repeat protein [Streptomyces sp. NPDC006134]|uniref:outer membrane protein assembly factor BamB family protein n=1 Tax=Streptomyces sp. NPDC006134 TaxID=3154467 RepID=UPI0033FCE4AD